MDWLFDKILAPGVVAVIFSGGVNLFFERFRGKRDLLNKLSDEIKSELNEMLQLSLEYWSRNFKYNDQYIEVRMTSYQSSISRSVYFLIRSAKIRGEEEKNLTSLLPVLFDSVTGGDFGTVQRLKDQNRLKLIITKVSDVKTNLTRCRIQSANKYLDLI